MGQVRPWYRRWWAYALGGLAAVSSLGAVVGGLSSSNEAGRASAVADASPRLTVRISNPLAAEVHRATIVIRGRAPENAEVRVDRLPPGHRSRRTFSSTVHLRKGLNTILVTASAPGTSALPHDREGQAHLSAVPRSLRLVGGDFAVSERRDLVRALDHTEDLADPADEQALLVDLDPDAGRGRKRPRGRRAARASERRRLPTNRCPVRSRARCRAAAAARGHPVGRAVQSA